ncbi:AraC family transcriptional regulator [Paenibacillus rhizovicinus]|uniref:AraC family transcriptional regulator n=1 Tax=Paenibacillus rhizovicinus TaxID=2704463 RepID=A0A6C0NZ85_9BACL|nr:AraC family transcriptional regulator [Paenibacillus rhizovicinus]QHW31003.1 AraC family transcriptional regulator [Paenibacillus rhizovicinus]
MDRQRKNSERMFPTIKSELYVYGACAGEAYPPWRCQRHLHHMMFELNLVLEGSQTVIVGNREYKQRSGELLLIPPMQPHEAYVDDPAGMRYFVMHVQLDDPAFLQLLHDSGKVYFAGDEEVNLLLMPELESIMGLLSDGSSRISVFHKLYGMLDKLEKHLLRERERQPVSPANTLALRIAQSIERMVTTPKDDISAWPADWLEEISRKLNSTRKHSYRVFQRQYGMSPREYMTILRQQEAMQLLLGGSDTVERIALRVGYDNPQSFIRQFAKWTGATPGEFRRNRRSQEDIYYLIPLEVQSMNPT